MSLAELKTLQKAVAKTIEGYEDRKRSEALLAIEAKAREFGFSLTDLLGESSGTVRRKRSPAVPRYRHPENPAITWSGRGRKPAWFQAAIEAGNSPDSLAV
ncbi:MAG: transcriptional regulator [Cereibacter sphaeroides]|uniref:Transcriptional regulator n=1 Tax=Cereibacter sphaeroides TaxID=1063 RepID=A0A2W5UDU4_CERSP|nr:MAG: transcriptional regulator [Cereibacter sphaeroides]